MSTIPLQASEVYNRRFSVRDVAGFKIPADSLPTATLYRNGSATAVSVTVAPADSPTTEYTLSFTVPSDADDTDSWALLIAAVVDTVPNAQWVTLTEALSLGGTVTRTVTLRDASGTATNADITSPENPSAVVVRNNVDTAESVTISQPSSPGEGRYVLSFTIPSGWTLRDELALRISATIDGESVTRLWYLGQIVDSEADLVLTVTTLDVIAEVEVITVSDDSEVITVTSEDEVITLSEDCS